MLRIGEEIIRKSDLEWIRKEEEYYFMVEFLRELGCKVSEFVGTAGPSYFIFFDGGALYSDMLYQIIEGEYEFYFFFEFFVRKNEIKKKIKEEKRKR